MDLSEWLARQSAKGRLAFVLNYGGDRRGFSLGEERVVMRSSAGRSYVLHEVHRPLLQRLGTLTSVEEITLVMRENAGQMSALFARLPQHTDRWHANQLADVRVFTDNASLKLALSKFMTVADTAEDAGIIVLQRGKAEYLDAVLGKVLYAFETAYGSLQVWDARTFPPPSSAAQFVDEFQASSVYVLASLLIAHTTSFLLDNQFVELNPWNATIFKRGANGTGTAVD